MATKQQNNLLASDPTSQPAALFLTLNVLVGLPSDPPDSASGVQGTQVFKVPGSARGPSRAGGAASVQASAERQQSVNSLIFPLALFLFIYFFFFGFIFKTNFSADLAPLGEPVKIILEMRCKTFGTMLGSQLHALYKQRASILERDDPQKLQRKKLRS